MKHRRFLRDLLLTVSVLLATVIFGLHLADNSPDNNPFAVPLFVLAVAVIARFTTGYFFGIAASVFGVFCVNYIFSFPFWDFDMSISGYPLTFSVMLIVSILISTLTTQTKEQERLRYEAQTEKIRVQLLRSVSHDLRTPLASILGSVSALIDSPSMPECDRQELLAEIQKNVRWLIRVSENVLSATRFSGEVRLKKTDEIVEEIIGSAIVKFRRVADLPVQVIKPDDILIVPMDATLIEQVILNLLENVAYHAKGATKILLSVTAYTDDVTFSVSDDGCGFPPEFLPHAFEKYAVACDGASSDGHRSMGIGLTVCRAIIAAHGGTMTAENNPAGGATVTFRLPCHAKEESQWKCATKF